MRASAALLMVMLSGMHIVDVTSLWDAQFVDMVRHDQSQERRRHADVRTAHDHVGHDLQVQVPAMHVQSREGVGGMPMCSPPMITSVMICRSRYQSLGSLNTRMASMGRLGVPMPRFLTGHSPGPGCA